MIWHNNTYIEAAQTAKFYDDDHLASPITGDFGHAHWPQLGNLIHFAVGHQMWGPLGQEALTSP